MEMDGLFVGTKWDVLTVLAKGPISPQDLAEQLNTSLANISQQVKFLEFAEIVERRRENQKKVGKPTTSLSIKEDLTYCVRVSTAGCKKTLIKLDAYQNLMFLAWENFGGSERENFEDFLCKNRKLLKNIAKIGFKDGLSTNLYVFLDNTPNTKRLKVGSLDFIFLSNDTKTENLSYIYKRWSN